MSSDMRSVPDLKRSRAEVEKYFVLFMTCVSIVIVLHSWYRAAVSALFSHVVLLIMHCKVACCTFHVWANTGGRKEVLYLSVDTVRCVHCAFYADVYKAHFASRDPLSSTINHGKVKHTSSLLSVSTRLVQGIKIGGRRLHCGSGPVFAINCTRVARKHLRFAAIRAVYSV